MAKQEDAPTDQGMSALDRVKDELSSYIGAQGQRLIDSAGGKLSDLAEGLGDSDGDGGGGLLDVGKRVMGGENPVKAFVGEKAGAMKDKAVDSVKSAFGGGGGSSKAGSPKVMNIIETIDVGKPLRTVYDRWAEIEEFSSFTKGVTGVKQSDEIESDWKLKVAFSNRSWKATVQEQVPDDRILWTSEGAKGTTRGAITFHELAPSLTRVVAVVEYTPSGFFEKTGNLWRAQGRRLRLDLKHFQRYVTLTGDDEEVEGWRGEIRDGEVVRSHEEGLEDDEDQGDGEEEEEEEGDEEYEDEEEEDEDGNGEEGDDEGEEEEDDDAYEDDEEDEDER
ncbi:SRPBCC family protein [Streptomyces sp. SID10853]|uniref:SRPBCC family protein n=1 Tax=Streptomyces sp. SID10853 TaxID=2706028 RepID=UPI0013BF5AA0|nr:SRPBCC family protein [Streptomyces sp. SID10853]NDZ80972.1 SRPBCC family protein [Streptomyces sp. SID10853]